MHIEALILRLHYCIFGILAGDKKNEQANNARSRSLLWRKRQVTIHSTRYEMSCRSKKNALRKRRSLRASLPQLGRTIVSARDMVVGDEVVHCGLILVASK
jgi:hypothetical protein